MPQVEECVGGAICQTPTLAGAGHFCDLNQDLWDGLGRRRLKFR